MLSHFCNILQSYPRELFGLYDEKVFKRTGKFRNGAVDWSVKIELCSEISICGGCGLFFGHSGERVKGLVFCSRKDEARELSAKFNRARKKDGSLYRTAVLTGEDSQEQREAVINRLKMSTAKTSLIIFLQSMFSMRAGSFQVARSSRKKLLRKHWHEKFAKS